ncbi:hypothetical protein F4782DRAFT_549316 [Xylaria castorea]|nr:hypothetical protein F4782DRAFT_549316 [Xylaria castorea]
MALERYLPAMNNFENKFRVDSPTQYPRRRLMSHIAQADPIGTNYSLESADYFTFNNMRLLSGFKIRDTNNLLHHQQVRKLGEDRFLTEVSIFDQAKVRVLWGIDDGNLVTEGVRSPENARHA